VFSFYTKSAFGDKMSSVQASETPQVIAYYRKSQEQRGQVYSIDRQRTYVEDFCKRHNLEISATFEETHTGRRMDREEFNKALQLARKTYQPIIISHLSRLGRDASAVIGLLNTEKIIVASKGITCDKLTLGIVALIDQNESERISERTSQGLQEAKKRGVKLGNPQWEISLARGQATIKRRADEFALNLQHLIMPLRFQSGYTLQEVADVLNNAEVKTRRGGSWDPKRVSMIIKRVQRMTTLVEGQLAIKFHK
jgi:DNA invertase Pin-like site-specific DNA recombinase